MSNYRHCSRQIGQIDEEGLELLAFNGPVELWKTRDNRRYSVYLYLVPEQDYKLTARKSLNVKRSARDTAWDDIHELYDAACDLVSHISSEHPMNRYFYP